MRVKCCDTIVSRTREERFHVWFICWTCGFVQRIRTRFTPGIEALNNSYRS